MRAQPVNSSLVTSPPGGFCLYLGERGGRCSLPARESGYCAQHDPELVMPEPNVAVRRLLAVLALLAVLWPLLLDFVRLTGRLLR